MLHTCISTEFERTFEATAYDKFASTELLYYKSGSYTTLSCTFLGKFPLVLCQTGVTHHLFAHVLEGFPLVLLSS